MSFVSHHNHQPKLFRWRKWEVKGAQLRNNIINFVN